MHGFSTVDGFVEITESLAAMIKYVANEPSVGLFYIQQHTQNAVPNVVNLKNSVTEKTHETSLHTEDSEDSISMLRSMKECGFTIADDMIRDIRKSLAVMSTKQPKRGLIQKQASGFHMGKTSPWRSVSWGRGSVFTAQQDDEKNGNYFSTVIKSARETATNFKWPQLDSRDTTILGHGEKVLPCPTPPLSFASAESSSSQPDMEADELPLSSLVVNDELHKEGEEEGREEAADEVSSSDHNLSPLTENFDYFKADKEAKLEEWLERTDTNLDNDLKRASEVLGL